MRRTRNPVYSLRCTEGSNPSLSATGHAGTGPSGPFGCAAAGLPAAHRHLDRCRPIHRYPFAMSQAQDILRNAADADAAARVAEVQTDLVDDEPDAMLYTFDDDSVLVICGLKVTAFDDIDAARRSIGL